MSHEGSCLCGAIAYAVDGEIGDPVLCHCSDCRKATGSAYAANAPVAAAGFRLLRGTQSLREYESSPGKLRAFCCGCGTPLYVRWPDDPTLLRLRLGTLDTPLGKKPVAHIFASSRADWDVISDGLPQYDGREPGRQGEAAPPHGSR